MCTEIKGDLFSKSGDVRRETSKIKREMSNVIFRDSLVGRLRIQYITTLNTQLFEPIE